jgi:hypothetical protein
MSREQRVAFVKLYGKILGYILMGVLMISTSVISSRAVKALTDRDTWRKQMEERINCIEREQLTREDIRAELNAFKLDLIESGMVIVPSRNKESNGR